MSNPQSILDESNKRLRYLVAWSNREREAGKDLDSILQTMTVQICNLLNAIEEAESGSPMMVWGGYPNND